MLFSLKQPLPHIRLYDGENLLYEGPLHQIPFTEESIIGKSIEFFRDPEPCHIHRNAVRTRLTSEIHAQLLSCGDTVPTPLLLSCADFPRITRFELYQK